MQNNEFLSGSMRDEEQQALQAISRALEEARRQGVSAAEATVSAGSGLTATVRMGDVESIEHRREKALSITVYRDGRRGSANTTDLNPKAITASVGAAAEIARHTVADACAGLVEAELMAREVPDLDLFHPWGLTPEGAVEIAQECEDAARAYDPRIRNSEGATVSSFSGTHAYGNSHGFSGSWRRSYGSIGCTVIAQDDQGMQRDYWHSASCHPAGLEDPAQIGIKAARRALGRLGARKIETRKVPVLFEARIARSVFGHFIAAISGTALYRKASFLVGHLGKQIFPLHLRIHEQPHLHRALGSAPFDGDGVATQVRDIVREGVLRSYVLSGYSARKLGMQTTGNAGGVRNLTVEPGSSDREALTRHMEQGFLVTELMGFGVNSVTGDYSRGASGYWVEHGQIQFPIEELTIASNLKDMFLGIVAVGNDVDTNANIRTGSLLIENMTVAGK
ncbi:MAG: metalloprotease PmbA [Gammaproteobacteria bacterium]